MTAKPIFRPASTGDASRIARLHADSWRVAYRGILTDEYLDGPVFADRESLWFSRFVEGHDAPLRVIVMETAEGELLGFGCLRPDADPQFGVLLDNLHVRPDIRHHGLGTQLITAVARESFTQQPDKPLHLWVLEANRNARAFYQRRGGEEAGTQCQRMPDGREYACLRVLWSDPYSLVPEQ